MIRSGPLHCPQSRYMMIEMSSKILLLLTVLVALYLVLGGLAFYYLERAAEEQAQGLVDLTPLANLTLSFIGRLSSALLTRCPTYKSH